MSDYSIPRRVFIWIQLLQLFLLLPHFFREPALLIPIWFVCNFWRYQVYLTRWHLPVSWVKTLVVVGAVFLVAIVNRQFSVEAAANILLMAFIFKVFEMQSLRDVLLVVYLSFFVLVAELLFNQSIITGIYAVLALLLAVSALVSVHQNEEKADFFSPLKTALNLLLASLPVMLLAFFVFPRLDPLWSVPQPSGQGKTGVNNRMSPGFITDLVKSDELAFRVTFDGEIPPQKDMYWRAAALSEFDGRQWLEFDRKKEQSVRLLFDDDVFYEYEMMVEPTYQSLLFVLDSVASFPSGTKYFSDLTIRSHDVIDSRRLYKFRSGLKVQSFDEYEILLSRASRLPSGFNPKALAFAEKLRLDSDDDYEFIDKVLTHFREEEFYYTLSPEPLGRDSVDDFLFKSRKGFCEHYASSFVVLMRAVGIPARVVVGYQGGDVNPFERYVLVRQLDAHAWTEVWIDGQWQRFDPTYAVAPERIEQGSVESLRSEPEFLEGVIFSAQKYDLSFFRNILYRYDQLNFLWNQTVLNYKGEKQYDFLKSALGDYSLKKIAALVIAVFAFVFAFLMAMNWLKVKQSPMSDVEKVYRKFLKKVARKGVVKAPTEGPLDFAQRCGSEFPGSSTNIEQIIDLYISLNYAQRSDNASYSVLKHRFKRAVMHFQISD